VRAEVKDRTGKANHAMREAFVGVEPQNRHLDFGGGNLSRVDLLYPVCAWFKSPASCCLVPARGNDSATSVV
jgi:hypothetical protein